MNWVLTGVSTEILTALAAAMGLSVVTMYLLRTRRRRVEVPFAGLWAQVVRERTARSLWDRIKRWVSLLLQLLLVGALLLALADPRAAGDLEDARSVVLLVDTSASMATLDEVGSRTRMDRAIDEARALLDDLGARDEVMLVRFDGQLEPLTPFTNEPDAIDELVRDLAPTDTRADVREAMRFAVDALAGRPRGEIVLISDGAFGDDAGASFDVSIPGSIDVVHVPVGTATDNVAITAFNVRRYPANRTNYEVFVEVRSYAEVPVTVELSIRGGGALVERERIDLGAGEHARRVYAELPGAGERLSATIEIVAGDAIDRFDRDDTAWAMLPTDSVRRVLLVTEGNLYLEGPFLLNPSIDTTTITPDAYVAANFGDPSADYDLTVFDGVTPPIADDGNFLFFGPTGEHSPWEVTGTVDDPIIHTIRREHPLMAWIRALREVNIASASQLAVTSDDVVLASAISGAPMIVARDGIRQRLAAVAFDVTASDLPLRVAFPVFLMNALDWLGSDDGELVDAWQTGETWFVPLPDRSIETVTVTAPSGRTFDVQAHDGRAVFRGDEVGFWAVDTGTTTFEIPANLADSAESDIAPADPLVLGDLEPRTEWTRGEVELQQQPWVWLVLAVFGLLILEWFTWSRRWTV